MLLSRTYKGCPLLPSVGLLRLNVIMNLTPSAVSSVQVGQAAFSAFSKIFSTETL